MLNDVDFVTAHAHCLRVCLSDGYGILLEHWLSEVVFCSAPFAHLIHTSPMSASEWTSVKE